MIRRMRVYRLLTAPLVMILAASAGCRDAGSGKTEADANAFLRQANDTLLRLSNEANQAGWVQNTYITLDTEAMAARANEAYMTAATNFAKRAASFDDVAVSDEERRQLNL